MQQGWGSEEPLKVAPPRTKPHPSFPTFSKKTASRNACLRNIVGLKAPDLCIYKWQARMSLLLSSFLLDQYTLHVDVNFICNYLDLGLQSWSCNMMFWNKDGTFHSIAFFTLPLFFFQHLSLLYNNWGSQFYPNSPHLVLTRMDDRTGRRNFFTSALGVGQIQILVIPPWLS